MKANFRLIILFIIVACSSPKKEDKIEHPKTIKTDSIITQEIKLAIEGSDSTGQKFLMQINELDSGFIKITNRGWEAQHMGYFEFDSTTNLYTFIPTQTFETDLCMSYYWGDPKLVIRGNIDFDGIIAHVSGQNIDTSFLVRDTMNVIEFEKVEDASGAEVTVNLELTKEPKFTMEEMIVNYYTTGICIWNNRHFNKAKIEITEDKILVYNLHEQSSYFKDKIECFNITK